MSGFQISDWIFFFTKEQVKLVNDVKIREKVISDFKSWILISIILPFFTYLLAAIFNVLLCDNIGMVMSDWPKIFINGSLPIISFGIISSGVPFLMEDLSILNPEVSRIRRRVMAVALLLLFLTASFYIFQTISVINDRLDKAGSALVLFLSVIIAFFSVSVGFKMFLLQSSFQKGIDEEIRNNANNMVAAIEGENNNEQDEDPA
ncbi:MAG: hypothetical protein JNK00_01635 [Flavipsychrobacter sp.]|nr:hypothetical protein [Flavipsychrobacter sp.]